MGKIRLGTVFSGIGAIEQALKRSSREYEQVFACDIDRSVKASYFANYEISNDRWFDDIHDIDGKYFVDNTDLLVGGSPCQSFSMVGKREGLEDFRGLLVYEFIRLVKEIKPAVFIFENVKGLLSHDKGNTWQILAESFMSIGYTIHWKVLNAKDYGIPQNRERLFVVGFKDFRFFSFPTPIPLTVSMQDFF